MPDLRGRKVLYWAGGGLILAILIPFLFAYWSAGDEFVFGGFLINPIDGNTYLAKMYQGYQGQWQYSMPYSAEVPEGAYLFSFYLFLGHFARVVGFSLPLTFHLARILSTMVMVWMLFRFFQALEFERIERNLVLVLVLIGSGLGWLGIVLGEFTSDLWVAEAYPFLSAFANPHFPLGLALIVWLLTPRKGDKGLGDRGLIGLVAFLLAIISPFGVIISLVVLGGMSIWEVFGSSNGGKNWTEIEMPESGKRFAWVLPGGGPVLGYYFWVVNTNPAFMNWNQQNLTPSPPLWDFLLSFSPVLILAIPGAWCVYRYGTRAQRILLVWAGLSILLAYAPLGLQRRFLMGLYIPLAGLAVMGVTYLASNNPKRLTLLGVGLFLLAIPTNLVILLTSAYGIQTHDPQIYLSVDEARALAWISVNTPKEAVILAAPETGVFIPAHAGRRVFYGHPFETIQADKMKRLVESYFRGELQKINNSHLNEADFVFMGPRERKLGDYRGSGLKHAVYENEGVSLYQINNGLVGMRLEE